METRINYAAVGLFILVLATLWAALSIWLVFGDPRVNYQRYVTYMTESVSGLVRDAAVRYRGVDVGRVKEISLRPGNSEEVMLILDIRKDAPIKTDTRATLRSQGLTGLYFVELEGGSKEAPLLEPGPDGEPPVLESTPSLFMRLDQAVTGLLDNLTQVTDRLTLLLSDENMHSLEVTMNSVAEFSTTVAEGREDIRQAIADARRSMADLRALTSGLAERDGDIQDAVGNLAEFSRQLPEVMEDVQVIAAELRSASETLGRAAENTDAAMGKVNASTITDINQALYELRGTLDSLERLGTRLEAQPTMLIYGEPERAPGPGERN